MTDEERDLMRRYIYQVVRRLPREQREETAMELEELITDMAAQKGMEAVRYLMPVFYHSLHILRKRFRSRRRRFRLRLCRKSLLSVSLLSGILIQISAA